MAFYIDSADRPLIEELWATGVFQGVTTNPTILSRAGLGQSDLPELYRWLTGLGVGTFYAQVVGTTTEAMLDSAAGLRDLGPLVVKVPATAAGFRAAGELVRDGGQVLLTAVYHPVQALLARDVGIQGVAPYVGRMIDAGRPGVAAVTQMQQAIGTEPTRILAASLRSADDVAALAAVGVPDFTVGEAVARAMLEDELTLTAVEEFEAAAAG
ncbi:transaldolase family protein [Ornithinicoccus hortensis]|uniref:Transaldolase n=1 Tax=Ornithinicoccus hortensis TaxID=82346 RepID=A0A542YM13_9MICO|nr:transaldolase family protein [Ornithinicoccus hortensis]TQL49004.1 transaldolase [Ornithinicoccus hortensis]